MVDLEVKNLRRSTGKESKKEIQIVTDEIRDEILDEPNGEWQRPSEHRKKEGKEERIFKTRLSKLQIRLLKLQPGKGKATLKFSRR